MSIGVLTDVFAQVVSLLTGSIAIASIVANLLVIIYSDDDGMDRTHSTTELTT
jgi:hypothetical protein